MRTYRPYIVFSDNQAVESILVKGYSNKAPDCNVIVGEFWDHVRDLRTTVWIDRVPTDMNPSDGASRGQVDQDCLRYGWERVQPDIPPHWFNEHQTVQLVANERTRRLKEERNNAGLAQRVGTTGDRDCDQATDNMSNVSNAGTIDDNGSHRQSRWTAQWTRYGWNYHQW